MSSPNTRTTTHLAAALLVPLACWTPLHAAQNLDARGVVWQVSYDADYLPNNALSDPAWTYIVSGPVSGSVSAGVLTFDHPSTSGAIYAEMSPSTWNGASGGSYDNTVEFRLRGVSGSGNVENTGRLVINNGQNQWTFGFKDIRVSLNSSVYLMDATTTFHTYRIVQAGSFADLYVDDVLRLSSVPGQATAANVFYFGQDLTVAQGTSEWDYVRFTNAGAFSALPEPTSLVLLACGPVLMLRRRTASR